MPITKPLTKRFYPALSEVITVDDLPEFLHFAETGLNTFLEKIHYKNLQYSKSIRGDAAFYSLDIISKNIGIDLPFGLRFVLNPDEDGDTTISSFPISLEYQWEILAFLRSFNLQNFSFTPDAFFKLGLQIFRISQEQVIAQTLNYFIDPEDYTTSKFQVLIDDINNFYPDADLVLPPDEEVTVELVAQMISQNPDIPESVSELMFSVYILDSNLSVTKNKLQQFYALMVPDGLEEYVKQMLVPKVKATLTLSAAIEFPNSILKPVTAAGISIPNTKTLFKFAEATFYVDTEAGIGAQLELAGSLIPEYNQIGNTGLTIGFTGAKLDLSRTTNIPEADAAGFPVDFMGLYVKHATIGFNRFGQDDTAKISAKITADNLLIGTGGVSGSIALESNGLLYRKFGNFAVELDTFSITFRQNAIINSDIKGKLTIGGFKKGTEPAVIDIQAHIFENGDFSITALPQSDLLTITLPNVLEIKIGSIALGKEERGFYIEVAGQLNFIANIPVLGEVLPKGIEIRKLRIWDNGDLEFQGGGLVVPKSFRLKVGPVKLEVTHLSIGSINRQLEGVERNYRYFGFDGMINTGMAGVNATGNGIKFYYTADNNDTDKPFDCFISIDRIAVDLKIPGNASADNAAFTLNGYLSVGTPDPKISGSNAGSEYSGAVTFTIPRLKLAGSAGMRLNPDIPAFVVDIGMELSTPIPLGATGLGIYGFRGLIGQHYMPSKSATTPPLPDDATWWEYYKAKSTLTGREGIEIDKFADKQGFSLGAGLSIATAFDSGKIFSSKLFLMLGLPDVLLIQGQAGILRSRIGLSDEVDPPFSAFIAIDSSSFRGNLGVNYRLPEGGSFDGALFTLNGTLDMAFFFNNASGWYLNIGKDQPESARVRSKILTLFQGYAYVMISSRGFKAGAGARFDFNKSFGPVKVGIGASIDLGGSLSFKPVQIGAFIQFGGYAYIKVWFIKLGLAVQISLAVEAPHPFNISGGLEIKIKVLFKKIKFRFDVSWHINNDYGPLLHPMPILELPNSSAGYLPAVATNILSSETFPVNYINYEINGSTITIPAPGASGWKYNFNDPLEVMEVTIPLDSFIDIELLKPVKPGVINLGGAGNQLPEGYTEMLPPQKGIGDQVRHEFQLTGVDIYAWHDTGNGAGSWVPYHIYEAVTAIVLENIGDNTVDLANLKAGYWQFTEPNMYNKIRLLSQNMFSYANQVTTASSDLDALNFNRKDVFCFENVLKETVVDWMSEPLNISYPNYTAVSIKGLSFVFEGLTGTVKNNLGSGKQSLFVEANGGRIVITLPKPVAYLNLDFGGNENDVRIDFVKTVYQPGRFGYALPVNSYMDPAFLSKSDQNTSITYNDADELIDKVWLTFERYNFLDYEGNLIIGRYFTLPDKYISVNSFIQHHVEEVDKALMFAAVFDRSFTVAEVLTKEYGTGPAAVGQWLLSSAQDVVGDNPGIPTGSPDFMVGFYDRNAVQSQLLNMNPVYVFSGNSDGFFIPFAPELKVESGSFAVEITAIFNPFIYGISTLLAKVNIDPVTGYKKGFALHLYQDTPGDAGQTYTAGASVPAFSVWLTCYENLESSGIKVTEKYTVDCATAKLSEKQYKHILVSVNRETGMIDIFIDRVLKGSAQIPAELGVFSAHTASTYLNKLSYLSEVQQRSQQDNDLTREGLINEIQVLSDNLNKTIQPVWRPDTTFAIAVKTRDVVNGNVAGASEVSHIFGFRTAGPVGHFQQQSAVYKALAAQDRAAEFKLAGLKSYIDYERSFPDAQSRYDLSKPVFYHDPQIRLLFVKPYMNAMFANWNSYLGLPAVNSSLQIQVFDPFGFPVSPELIWEQLPDVVIDFNNFRSLPGDQQILFLMNVAALSDACNDNPLTIKKRSKQGSYHLPDLEPNRLYTALFNAIYQPEGEAEQKAEVHKFSFRTSLFASFEEQAKSFILNDTPDAEEYAIYPVNVSFTAAEIDQKLKVLLDDNTDNDPVEVLRYAVKFDRMVYGGLELKNLEQLPISVIHLVINIDPDDEGSRKILGLLIVNPEPFNDPKLPADLLSDTLQLSLKLGDNSVLGPDRFVYIHSRDTSAVFITNLAMEIPAGNMTLSFRNKLFNGNDYQTVHEDYTSPAIQINTDF